MPRTGTVLQPAGAIHPPPQPSPTRGEGDRLAFRIGAAFYPMRRAAAWFGGLSARRRWLASFVLGVIAAGALPPLDVTPLLVVSFSGLVWILDGTPTRRAAFAVGWWFGFGFLLAGLYWIAIALTVDLDQFWWLLPLGAAGLPAVFALYHGIGILAVHAARFTGLSRILALALAWSVGEWLRGHLFTGFPWNLVGYTWSGGFPGSLGVVQSTSVVGIYGLSLVTVVLAALPALMADPIRRRWIPMAVTIAAPVLLGSAGAARLAVSVEGTQPGVRLRLVQPSIAQSLKLDPAAQLANFERHLALSAQGADPPPTLVIWPEAAAHFYLNRHEEARAVMARVLPPGAFLLAGTLRTDPPPEPPRHAWNSLGVLDAQGAFVASYDKFHLVPFGEYMPLRELIPIQAVFRGSDRSSATR
jgi:apolipoprotein N-acyltransferase